MSTVPVTDYIAELETPCLLLDQSVLRRNARRFLDIAAHHQVALRPHLKTSKSVNVANLLTEGVAGTPITVSTLAEADYFAAAGYSDILYAVGLAPNKFARAAHVQNNNVRLLLITDNVPVARAATDFCVRHNVEFSFLIEIDCGDQRGGVQPDGDALIEVAQILDSYAGTHVQGVMTHAGHSYGTNEPAQIAAIAEQERAAVVLAARRLRDAGMDAATVSVGSTPTVVFAESLEGVTEVRCGVYAFFDLDQYGRGVCTTEDMALSVLATVIGHNRDAGVILIDAGGLALSKDISAQGFLPDAAYGYVCRTDTMARIGGLSVDGVNQEHGKVRVDEPKWYAQLPIGSQVRVLPNHACFTAAAYAGYHVLTGPDVIEYWPRVNGW